MDEWIDRFADELGVEALDAETRSRLLDASREVAHRLERKQTPLSVYLIGVAVGRRIAAGTDPETAVDEALETLARLLPDPPGSDA
jgi:chromosomal replication initiation ATPase DnaA